MEIRTVPYRGGLKAVQVTAFGQTAALPAELDGVPLVALGDRAFTPGRKPEAGDLHVFGRPAAAPVMLKKVLLPDTVTEAGTFAFYGQRELEELELGSGLTRFGPDPFLNCPRLHRFTVRMHSDDAAVPAFLAELLSVETELRLLLPEGECRLLLPEYVEMYDENIPAHIFQMRIEGPGWPYHHCFHSGHLDLREYDSLWEELLRHGHEEAAAVRLALLRLLWPWQLEKPEPYLGYLAQRQQAALEELIRADDRTGLQKLLALLPPDRQARQAACETARQLRKTAMTALLLESGRRGAEEETFEL